MEKVNVLGTAYTLDIRPRSDDPELEDSDGYCDESIKLLAVADFSLEPVKSGSKKNLLAAQMKVMRHEIVHAFLCESGLAECSDWAQNEELVDWIAIQGPKIYKAWQEAGAV